MAGKKNRFISIKKKIDLYLPIIISISLSFLVLFGFILLWKRLGGIIFFVVVFSIPLILILISHYKDISIPFVGKFLRKEYQRVKNRKKDDLVDYFYYKFIYYSVLLFESSRKSFNILKIDTLEKVNSSQNKQNRAEYFYLKKIINQIKKGKKINKKDVFILEQFLIKFNRQCQKKAAIGTTMGVVFIMLSLISSLVFPAFSTNAATYYFTQVDWSGGVDTGTIANHTSNQSNWNKYYSKDALISVGTNISNTIQTATSTINFTTESNYILGDSSTAVTLTPSGTTGNVTLTLGSGNWNSIAKAKKGARIIGNGGIATLSEDPSTSSAIQASVNSAFSNTSAIASGSWQLVGGLINGSAQLNSYLDIDLSNWTQRNVDIGASSQQINSIIYDSVNSKYVAAGFDYSSTYDAVIWESTDLQTWTQRDVDIGAGHQYIYSIIYDSVNSKYVAAGYDYNVSGSSDYDAVVWESADLITWTQRDVDTADKSQYIYSIIYDSVNSKYVTAGYGYQDGSDSYMDAMVWESIDLQTWTKRIVESKSGRHLFIRSIIYDSTNSKYVAGGYDNDGYDWEAIVWESADLQTWTKKNVRNGSTKESIYSIIYDSVNSKYIAAGQNYNVVGTSSYDAVIWESTDLQTWTQRDVDTGAGPQYIYSIIYDSVNSKYVAVGYDYNVVSSSSYDAVIWESTDLQTWTQRDVDTGANTQKLYSVIYDSVNSKYIVAGNDYHVSASSYNDSVIWESGSITYYPVSSYYITTSNSSQFNTSTWGGVNSVIFTQTTPTNTNIKYLVSFDGRVTWKYWSGSAWTTSTLGNIEINGNSKATLEALSNSNWASSGGFITETTSTLDFASSLSTTNISVTPALDSLDINYVTKHSDDLISSKFDVESAQNIMGGIEWVEDSTLPLGSQVTMYLRTASSQVGLDSASWNEIASSTPSFLTSGCTKVTSAVVCSGSVIPAALKDVSNDQWFQYKVSIKYGATSPTVDNVTSVYVVNAPPVAGEITAVQGADGVVDISYKIKDSDTSTGVATPNYVTPTFEYYNGLSWSSIATTSITFGSAPSNGQVTDINNDGDIDNKVLENSYLTYTATWLASTTISGLYTSAFKIRLTANDNEVANNTVSSTTVASILDTKAPTSPNVFVYATSTPASLALSATDDSSLQMKISLNSDLVGASWEAYNATSTITLATDPDTVYVRFKDVYGNEGNTVNVTTPNVPNSVSIQDISNINISPAQYEFYLVWGVVSIPSSGFSSYKVYHSVDGSSYSLESTINDRNQNYYVDRGLSQNSVHYYKVVSVDLDGNISSFSSVVTGTANGTQDGTEGGGGVEAVPPVISNVVASNITTQSVTITWDTDELSDSRIEYIMVTGADFTNSPFVGKTSMLNTDAGIGQHSIVLTGLTPNTTYYYQVKSTDINSNTAIKSTGNDGFSFSTLSGAEISDVNTDTVNNESAIITWTTDIADDSYVVYSTNSDLSSSVQTGSSNSTTSHSVTVSGLSTGIKYYYYVKSGLAEDKNIILGDVTYYSFTTTQDTTAPIITFDSSTQITDITDTSGTVSWSTNEIATSTLEYGLDTNYSSSTMSNNNYNSNHIFNLSGLSAGSTYYFRIKSTDSNSNTRTGDNSGNGYTLTTTDSADTTSPNITTAPNASIIGDTFAVISWATNESSDSLVDYGITSGDYSDSETSSVMGSSHSIELSGLTADTQYYFKVKSIDSNSNATTSIEYNFTTLEVLSEESAVVIREGIARTQGINSGNSGGGGGGCYIDNNNPVISNIDVSNITSGSATIKWRSNEIGNSIVEYGITDKYGKITGKLDSSATSHFVVLKNLSSLTKYYFKVRTRDKSGNIGEGLSKTFSTISLLGELKQDKKIISKFDENEFSSEEAQEQENLLKLATRKVNSIFSKMAGKVSVNKLEENLLMTTETINNLSEYIPAPILSSSPNVEVTSQSAVISWETDKPANSLVSLAMEDKYNLEEDKPYTEVRGDSEELTKSHVVILYNLFPDTTYHYSVKSKSQVGPSAESDDFTFTTNSEIPQITKWSIKEIGEHSAVFTWGTSVETSSEIEYTPYIQGILQKERTKTMKVPVVSLSHSITIDNLDGGITYLVKLKGKTQSGELVTYTIPRFNNVEDKTPPKILQLRTESAISLRGNKIQTIITWQTNEISSSQVFYQEGASVRKRQLISTDLRDDLVYQHTIVLGNLKPATVYRFYVESVDSQGNLVKSKDYTLLTPQKKQDITEIIFSNFEKKFGWLNRLGL